jgi:uncharacterized membrane protein
VKLRGWIAVNLFLLAMILVASGLLFFSLVSVRALELSDSVERQVMAVLAVLTLFATGYFGKWLLATIEKRSAR